MKKYLLLLLYTTFVIPFYSQDENAYPKCNEKEDPEYTIQGTLKTSSSTFPLIEVQPTRWVNVGDMGEISKRFETELFGGSISGWFVIGTVEIIEIKKDYLKFKVLQEEATLTINEKKQNQFKKGKTVKFSKYNYPIKRNIVEKWSSGKLKKKGEKICDTKVGKWEYFYYSGELKKIREYNDNGILDGQQKTFYENGNTKEVFYYKNGLLQGDNSFWYDNGNKKAEYVYDNGKKHGTNRLWYKNGNLKFVGRYKDNVLEKYPGKTYYENGGVQIFNHFDSSLNLVVKKVFYEDASLKYLNYYKQLPDTLISVGVSKSFFENGDLHKEIHYNLFGAIDSSFLYSEYGYLEEKLVVLNNVSYKNWYYSNGKIKQTSLINYSSDNDFLEFKEIYKAYYQNGQLAYEKNYHNSYKEGKWIAYYEDGSKMYIKYFSHDKKIGKWILWDENGKKTKINYNKKNKLNPNKLMVGTWSYESIDYYDLGGNRNVDLSELEYNLKSWMKSVFEKKGVFYTKGFKSLSGKWYFEGDYYYEKSILSDDFKAYKYEFLDKNTLKISKTLYIEDDLYRYELVMKKEN